MELGNFGWSSSGTGGGGGGTGTVTLVFASTGMAFTSITSSGGIAIDTAKVPYYSGGFSAGFAKWNGSAWIFDNSTYLTTASAASSYYPLASNPAGYLTSASLTPTDVTTALGYTPVNKAGDTMTGFLILNADPQTALGAATKQYVDNISAGINFHEATYAASTANLSANYLNGTSGVGATLTAAANGVLILDGVDFSLLPPAPPTDLYRVLIWQQSNQTENGLYVVSDVGSPSSKWVLTRATDADNSPSGELAYGDFSFNLNGTLYGGYGFIMNAVGTINIGSSNITYTQFNVAQSITAGVGLTESPTNTFNVDTTKVPYYSLGFSSGFSKWNGSAWIFDNSTYLTTSDAASTYLTQANAALNYYPLSSNPAGYITSAGISGTYVPYTGAGANVNLGVFNLTVPQIYGSTVASANLTLTSTSDATKGSIVMDSNILINEAFNITLGSTTGTKIGTATTQKLGFYNATPIVQPSAVTTPQGIATALTSLGLLATSTINSVTLTTTGTGGGATYDQVTNTLNIPTYVSSNGGTAVGTFSNVYAFNNFK